MCIFCKIINGEIPSKKVYEDENIFAFEDITPKAPVHILIIPKRHIETINNIGIDDYEIIGKIYGVAAKLALEKGISESGYRVTANCNKDAGQTVFHIHFHLMGGREFAWPPG